ncbi:Molybdopterin molybdenumtransferase [archaeon HR01]|nr:Molybdopterin molybdenumtransferase [archaeon HR01]
MAQGFRNIKSFTPVEEAVAALLQHLRPFQEYERLPVLEAVGRVAAKPVHSPRNAPPYDASHMDGFAVNHQDLKAASLENPIHLRLVGSATPGPRTAYTLKHGEAVRILTGAYLPEGADAVVPQEEVSVEDGLVKISRPVSAYEYVDRRGFDIREGEVVVQKGEMLRPPKLVFLAHLGVWEVEVVRRPVVGLLAVGDELTDNPHETQIGKIFNTHTHIIQHMLTQSGAKTKYMGVIPDNLDAVGRAIAEGLQSSDMLITIAGSSVGDRDVSSRFLRDYGADIFIHGLRLQPGRVGGLALVRGKPLIMLPGLIMSTLNVFMFTAYPVLRYMMGMEPRIYARRVRAELSEEVRFRKYLDFKKVVWVKLVEEDEHVKCMPVPGESSGMSIPAKTDGFIVAGPAVEKIEAGKQVWVNIPPY